MVMHARTHTHIDHITHTQMHHHTYAHTTLHSHMHHTHTHTHKHTHTHTHSETCPHMTQLHWHGYQKMHYLAVRSHNWLSRMGTFEMAVHTAIFDTLLFCSAVYITTTEIKWSIAGVKIKPSNGNQHVLFVFRSQIWTGAKRCTTLPLT